MWDNLAKIIASKPTGNPRHYPFSVYPQTLCIINPHRQLVRRSNAIIKYAKVFFVIRSVPVQSYLKKL